MYTLIEKNYAGIRMYVGTLSIYFIETEGKGEK